MAIEKSLTRTDTSFGYEFPTAYIKIAPPEIRGSEVYIHVWYYADKAARDANSGSINKTTEKCKLSDLTITDFTEDGIKAACYQYLKGLPKYQGADV